MPEIQTPEWVKDAIFYQIFPDRFAKSDAVPKASGLQPWGVPPTPHGYQGGDLLGVAEHLDYLADLGINAIYFNPIFRSGSNHRYHTHDYYQVDPMLGGNAAFRTLLDAAHARGHAALAHHLEQADVAGAQHVRAATELAAGADVEHAHRVAIFLAEQHHRAGLLR